MNTVENTIRVLIADSQFLITESLKHILLEDMRFQVSNVVMEKRELTRELANGDIALLIIDPSFIELSSFSELKEIINQLPSFAITCNHKWLNKERNAGIKQSGN